MSKDRINKYMEEVQARLNKPDRLPKSSLNQVERFTEDIVWQDIKDLIIDNIEYLRERLEVEPELDNIRLLQGGIMELKRVLEYPMHLHEHIQQEMENREIESETNIKEGDNNVP